MDEKRMLLRRAEEKIATCENQYTIECTNFLDPLQESQVRQGLHLHSGEPVFFGDQVIGERFLYRDLTLVFTGGYAEAERQVLAVLPEYIAAESLVDPEQVRTNPDLELLNVVRFTHSTKATRGHAGGALGHRDYLGALMGLGIKREVLGDLLVREDGADCFVLPQMATYIADSLTKAGQASLSAEVLPFWEAMVPEKKEEECSCTLASLRLDNVLSAAFKISRTEAKDAIAAGLVFVDHREAKKADQEVTEGSLLVIRHRGRARLQEVAGETRKGRVRCTFLKS